MPKTMKSSFSEYDLTLSCPVLSLISSFFISYVYFQKTPHTYKLDVIVHRCRHGKAPQYLVDCCTPVTDVVGRPRLRSATQQMTVVPRHRLSTVGHRAFAVQGPMVWNSLPDDFHAQQDYESFRQRLKTWLF